MSDFSGLTSCAWALASGTVFYELKQYDESLAAYGEALSLKPDLANAWFGRGNVLLDLKRYDEAFAAYDKALSLTPHSAEAWVGRGNVFLDLKEYDRAFADYDKAFSLKPDLTNAEGLRLSAKISCCMWSNLASEC